MRKDWPNREGWERGDRFNGAGAGGYFSGGKSPTVELIQRGTVAITAGNPSNTATITSAATARSRVRFLGCDSPDTVSVQAGYITQTNATTITAFRRGTTTGTQTFSYEITTYAVGMVNSLQVGILQVSAASPQTVTITSVTTTRAEMDMYGFSSDSAVGTQAQATGVMTNATTLTFNRQSSGNTLYYSWGVLEWAL